MNTSCDTKSSFLNVCHPYVTIGCIISCFICTVVMIWWVYAMRVDMAEMRTMSMNMSTMDMTNTPPMSTSTIDHSSMDMSDPMSMSMRDMGNMLAWKTGDDLDKAFLEGMIPHHQWAVDMAKYLVNAKHPELQKMGQEIISAQEKEITQMKQWMIDWWYTQNTTLTPQEEMMREHCKTMPEMAGCDKYK